MSCSDRIDRISRMFDGSLDDKDLRELRQHIAGCERCRAEFLLQKELEAALGTEVHSGLSAGFTERVSAKALEISKRQRRPRPWLVLVPPLATAAAATSLFFLGLDLVSANPSAFDSIVPVLLKPVGWLSQLFSGLSASASKLQGVGGGSLGGSSGSAAGLVIATLMSLIPAAWGFRRVLVFMKR